MLKILAQIACSSIFAVSIVTQAQAKDVPLVKQITFKIPLKEFSIIEFPFEIKSHDFSPFVSLATANSSQQMETSSTETPDYSLPNLDDKKSQQGQGQKPNTPPLPPLNSGAKKPVDWQKGKNFFKFYPRKTGETQLVVFGYEKFPIIINLKIVEDKEQADDRLLKFVDFNEHKEVAHKFESTNHDKVVVSITKALYTNEPPKGYEVTTKQYEFIRGPLMFQLIKEYQGKSYSGIEYLLTNIGTSNIDLDADIFKGQKGVYGITFTHDILVPSAQTRLFIVKQRNEDD